MAVRSILVLCLFLLVANSGEAAPAVAAGHVTGVGGVFFKAKDPKALAAWYRDVLGLPVEAWGGAALRYDAPKVFSVHGDPPPSIVAFPRDGEGFVVPIFTSENALLHDKTMALDAPHSPCVSWVPFRSALERAQGQYVHINPGSQFNRSFRPEQIAWLLTDEAEHFFRSYR
jgi:catechol 2,3-dioxygenase-like lactoylglutathione lyase family enzyme